MNKQPTVYITASTHNRTLNIGAASHLTGRVRTHKNGGTKPFPRKREPT